MNAFNIIVGIANIVSMICAIISIKILQSLNNKIKNNGNDNINNIIQSKGVKNQITATIEKEYKNNLGGTKNE